ncbi:hypothetical protein [Chryseobacterium lacus]|mgnify:FL=1|uniref:hypothetical protein n=1 Tax=Chryseobacterium lacus TaxID=2058346 RepID=UPI000869271A|nr:hypothetical protein [Chryseobacterium lacus]ODS90026.1 MAG: hypothetical protein ABS44_01270 [Chryseobacterium sp. SCN 40-13]RST28210.1 hypothetical protein EIZ46_03110 [Chryseobacterium lacus]
MHNFYGTKLNYLHLNPVRAGIVEKAVHYIDSSASTYALGKGMVDITFAENQSLTPLKAVSSGNTIVD